MCLIVFGCVKNKHTSEYGEFNVMSLKYTWAFGLLFICSINQLCDTEALDAFVGEQHSIALCSTQRVKSGNFMHKTVILNQTHGCVCAHRAVGKRQHLMLKKRWWSLGICAAALLKLAPVSVS